MDVADDDDPVVVDDDELVAVEDLVWPSKLKSIDRLLS